MRVYRFPCGCQWPLLEDESDTPDGCIPLLDFDPEAVPGDCPAAWGLLGRGETKGIFQLESALGRQWTKKLKPENYEHIAALGAILRPGCLRAVDEDGVSMTQHYVRRKNREESLRPYHPAIDAILFPTYGVLAYQEQAMAICVAVAGFTEQEADMLRKAIGKKLPEEMAKCKKMFMEGAEKAGIITLEQAVEVFGWIEKSQRYSFNKSHAYCYGLTGYESAYIKAHFPVAFFAGWLLNARHKQDPQQEIFELVNDARLFDVTVEPPDLRSLEPDFHTDRKVVKFGLADIKGVGEAQVGKLAAAVREVEQELGKPLSRWTWWEFLVCCSASLTSSVVTRYIEVGALRWTGDRPRRLMVEEFKVWDSLTATEQKWVCERREQFGSLVEALGALGNPKKQKAPTILVAKKGREEEVARLDAEYADLCREMGASRADPETGESECEAEASDLGERIEANREAHKAATRPVKDPNYVPYEGPEGGCSTEARRSVVNSHVQLLKNPGSPLVDTPLWLAFQEEQHLGISLSCSRVDACDLSQVNCSCKEFLAGRTGFLMLGVEVQAVRVVKTKKGKTPGARMAFLTIADNTCSLDEVIVFPEPWKEFGHLLTEGNTVIIQADRDWKDKTSSALHVKKVWQASQSGSESE